MRFRGIIGTLAFLFLGTCLWAQEVARADESAFDNLETWQQRDFSIVLRKLYVIGDAETPSGLFEIQNLIVSDLELAASKGLSAPEAISTITPISFYRTRIADRTFEFRRSIAMQMSKIYQADLENQPIGLRSFDRVMTLKVLELKQKEFALLHPFISRFVILGGLKGFYVQQYFEALNLDPSLELLNSLKNGTMLTFENFCEALKLLSAEEVLTEQAFENYSWYRLIAPLAVTSFESKASLEAFLNQTRKELQAEADERKLNRPALETLDALIPFLWLLQNWRELNSESVSWDWKSEDIEALSGWNFLLSQYEGKWPEFGRLPEQVNFDEPSKKLIAEEVDEFVVSLFDADQATDFLTAIEDFQSGYWLDLPIGESSLRKLPEDLRRILAARLFPDLSLKAGRALLEGTWFETLTETERREVLSSIYGIQIPEDELKKILSLEKSSASAIIQYHYDLVTKYLSGASLEIEKPDSITLKNGEKVPLVERQRDQTRQFFAQNGDKLDYGWYPAGFIEYLTVLLYPSLDHLSVNEPKRFSNEWARQRVLHEMLIEQEKLFERIKNAKTEEQKRTEEEQLAKVIERYQETLAEYPIDPGSEATWIAAFLAGAKPHSNELPDILKAVGAGAVFAVAVKIFGIQAVVWFVALDTGTRLVSSGFLKDDLVNLNLDSGFSIPFGPGKMMAQSLQDGLRLFGRLQSAKSPAEELEAAYDLGSLGSDFVWFGVGASAVRWGLDLSSYRRARRASNLHREIQKIEKAIEQNSKRTEVLKTELNQRLAELESYKWTGESLRPHVKELSLRIDELRAEIFQLESVRLGRLQGPTEFYSKALIGSVIDLVKTIVPTSRPLAQKFSRMGKRWTARSRLGAEQYLREISRLESKISKIEADEWAWQSKPGGWTEARKFKSEYSSFKKAQDKMSAHIREAQIHLESASKVPPQKATSLYEAAQKSLNNARMEWAKSRDSMTAASEHAGSLGARSQPLNNALKAIDQKLTGSNLGFENLNAFPRRMRTILNFQRAWIEDLAIQIP